MAFELKEGQGSLFKAEKKNERAPDYEGKANVGGTMYRVAGWIKEGQNGKWMSLKLEVPRAKESQALPPRSSVDIDSDAPW